jgi:hypothetical protein
MLSPYVSLMSACAVAVAADLVESSDAPFAEMLLGELLLVSFHAFQHNGCDDCCDEH